MQKYEILYVPLAEHDLNEIADYLYEHSEHAANSFVDELEKLEERLETFPESAALSRNKRLRNKGYRMAVIEDYLLFYVLRKNTVYVMRVIHGKRNYLKML